MPKRETAAEREARYAEEVQADMARFEAEKPLRLLRVLARAQAHGLATNFYAGITVDDVMVRIKNLDADNPIHHDFYYSKLNNVVMSNIEYEIDELDEELKEKQRLAELKKVALSKLTKEEQQLLGLV
jgi:ribonucleotide reductase beta subunit family protein with ferritin-like domain